MAFGTHTSYPADFNDWRWQIKNCVKNIDELTKLLPKSSNLDQWMKDNFTSPSLPFSVTPYFVSLMSGDINCPIFLQVISSNKELSDDQVEMRDPLGEEERQHVPHLVHRYPDRVLFLATDRCASYCRFCHRKRWVGQGPTPKRDEQEAAFKYIEKDPEIKEIIFSGGEPFLLSNQRLFELMERSFSIKHIEIVRFHTRMLSFAPMRVLDGLCDVFNKFSPVYVVTHFNHPKEITPHASEALNILHRSGVVLLNQSALLKGINDNEETLKTLCRVLIKNRVLPYYMHQCDLVTGATHFRVPIARSIELMNSLRGHISGLCQPSLVIDIPGGHGKVPLCKNPIVREDEDYIYLQGFNGGVGAYPKDGESIT